MERGKEKRKGTLNIKKWRNKEGEEQIERKK